MKPKNILVIDKNNLDEEWARQPEYYYDASLDLAEARNELNEAVDALEVIEARADKQFREDPTAFGFSKATDATAKSAVILDARVRDAKKRVREAKDAVAKLWAKVSALDHKKSGLESEVKLHGQGFFSKPVPPKEQAEEYYSRQRISDLKRPER